MDGYGTGLERCTASTTSIIHIYLASGTLNYKALVSMDYIKSDVARFRVQIFVVHLISRTISSGLKE